MAPRKDYYASTVKMKAIWHKNVIDLNNADHVEKLAMDGKPTLIQVVTNAMRWTM